MNKKGIDSLNDFKIIADKNRNRGKRCGLGFDLSSGMYTIESGKE
jgi:hypothetical protein